MSAISGFEARQKRFTFDGDHYFLDLVFYNRLLRCYVVVDLKFDKLTHQDLGQMQMYVNHYDRHVKLPDENPTVGLLLWIAFNALYGQWDQTVLEPAAARRSQLVDSALGFAYARPNCISLAAIPWL